MDHMDFEWNCMDHMDFLYRYMFVGCKKPNPRINSYGIKSMESFLSGWIHGLSSSN